MQAHGVNGMKRGQRHEINKSALEWAKKELARINKKGWPKDEINHHILAEIGREFNIGAQDYVQKKLKLEWPEPEPEPPDEDEDNGIL